MGYTLEVRKAAVSFYLDNSLLDTAKKFDVSTASISAWFNKAQEISGVSRTKKMPKQHSLDLIHCACQHYTHHVWWQTCEVFNISPATLYKWRFDYGYSNKHYGRNMSKDKTDNDVLDLFNKAQEIEKKQKADLLQRLENIAAEILDMQKELR